MKSIAYGLLAVVLMFGSTGWSQETPQMYLYDLVVYGGNAGGAITAISASNEGLNVALLEPRDHIGGLTSGGLGRTDVGDSSVIGGLSREFYQRVAEHYKNDDAWISAEEQKEFYELHAHRYGKDIAWRFEPHVAEMVLNAWLDEAGVEVYKRHRLDSVGKIGNRISYVVMENGSIFRGKVFVDTTYEGDLMARAGVSYTTGREGREDYGESLAGRLEYSKYHQFDVNVSPFDAVGNVLPLVQSVLPGTVGGGDKKIQAYNFRLCFTDVEENRLPFPKPDGYDPARFELLRRYLSLKPDITRDEMFIWSMMPNRKTDINNKGPISTDYIGMNWAYPEADYETRAEIWQDHLEYTQGLFYFLANDSNVPDSLQAEIRRWGPCKDEYQDTNGWPHQLYVREARRMIGAYVQTQHDCQTNKAKPDSIGMGSYTMDSHHVQRFPTEDGFVLNEGDLQVSPGGAYAIPYRSITPKESECSNLLVPVCLSTTHVAFGSVRMEPVFMVLGHSAGVAARMAIERNRPVQRIDAQALVATLREQGQVLSETDRIEAARVGGNP